MKNILLGFFFFSICGICFANQTTLVCKGWRPFYRVLNDWPISERSENDDFTIKLDMKKRVATYPTQEGDIATNFSESGDYYWGKTQINRKVLGSFVTVINMSINRFTGSTTISYYFNETDAKVVFAGSCAPGKALF